MFLSRLFVLVVPFVLFAAIPAFPQDSQSAEATTPTLVQFPPMDPLLPADDTLTAQECAEGLAARLANTTATPKELMALAILQLCSATEQFTDSISPYIRNQGMRGGPPLAALPPAPATPLRYEDLRQHVKDYMDRIAQVEATLSQVPQTSDLLVMHLAGRTWMSSDLPLSQLPDIAWPLVLMGAMPSRVGFQFPEANPQGVVGFDMADVSWLRAYCHLAMAVGDILLAHDSSELFGRVGHLVFANTETGYWHPSVSIGSQRGGDEFEFLDFIAAIHLLRFPVVEPDRMASAREHLLLTITLSRIMWKDVDSETDDNFEWLPNASQSSAIIQDQFNPDDRAAFDEMLAEVEAVLQGTKLLPFWREPGGRRGINLRRVFDEPRMFDLVLWVQGSDAAHYLEEGPVSSTETWRLLNRRTMGRLFFLTAWAN